LKEDIPIYFFVNPVEYHGPHLSLHTDLLISKGLSQNLYKVLNEANEHPYYYVQYDIGADPAPGPGSVNVRYKTLSDILIRQCRKLVKLGAKKIIFMTFHGAPLHLWAIENAIEFLEKNNARGVNPFVEVVNALSNFDTQRFKKLENFLGENYATLVKGDYHAGCFETSICLSVAKESVSNIYKELSPCPDLKGNKLILFVAKLFSLLSIKGLSHDLVEAAHAIEWSSMKPPLGYTGRPSLASVDIGDYLCSEFILPEYEKMCLGVLWNNKSRPVPPMGWLKNFSILL
jgi:creatinine amidohydrolase